MTISSGQESIGNTSGATPYQPYRSVEEFGEDASSENATLMLRDEPTDEFINNQEERCPILLCLDRSGSMNGTPIKELKESIEQFRQDLLDDPAVAAKVDVGVISFNHLVNWQDFQNSTQFTPPPLSAQGGTKIAFAMEVSLDMCEKRKDSYRENGIAYHRPWIILITDGKPDHDSEEEIDNIRERLESAEQNRRAAIFTIACGNQSRDIAQWLTDNISPSNRPAKRTNEANFKELFRWLSNSQIALSKSSPGERTQLPSTDGWEIV